jgi:hypothetical protein
MDLDLDCLVARLLRRVGMADAAWGVTHGACAPFCAGHI